MKTLTKYVLCTIFIMIFLSSTKAYASDEKITMVVGDKIELSGKGYYGSSDKTIASVNKKGVIKAKKAGVCNIVFVDKKNNASIYEVTVKSKANTKKKGTLYIGKNGWSYENPTYCFDNIKIELYETKINDLYDLLDGTDYDNSWINLNDKGIYDSSKQYSLSKKDFKKSQYVIYCEPSPTKYFKDMTVEGIIPSTDTDVKNSYWFNKTFSVKNAPQFDSFKEDILEKFSGYVEDNVEIIEDGNRFIVKIKVDRSTLEGKNIFWISFWYVYDRDTRECSNVTFMMS